jgi:capsular exopolysaccharide synthesis family protein
MNRENRDTQLAPFQFGNAPAQLAPWEQGPSTGGGLGAANVPPQQTPLRKMHRLLRGRYLLAIFLAVAGAAAGGLAGFMSQKPQYSSTGIISISGLIPSIDHRDVLIQMYGQHMAKQVAWLTSERLLNMAMNRPDFKAVRQFNGAEPQREFSENLKVQHLRNTDQIAVTFTDLDPAVAPLAVKAVIRTYNDHFKGRDLDYVKRKTEYWDFIKDEASRQINLMEKQIAECVGESGWGTDDLTPLIKSQQEEQVNYTRDAMIYKQQLETLKNGKAPELSVEDIARIDGAMLSKLQRRDQIKADLAHHSLTLLPQHKTIVLLQKELLGTEQEIEQYAESFRKKWVMNNTFVPGGPGGAAPNGGLMARDPEQLEQMVRIAERQAEDNKFKTAKLGDLQSRIHKAKTVIADQTEKLKQASAELDKLRFQQESVGEVTTISEGNAPVLAVDNRLKFSLLGVILGGGLPVGLLMLFGVLDRRYRYSDEPGGDASGITLLGILPNLPDRLSDPEQAAIAAHCVHQIRTMLQINGSAVGAAGPESTDDRRVFAVTSAAPGDGKTSLTLALGLSYAACGTRTLLIDCDLVGGGLTSRMNVHAAEGVLEAITDRSLLPYVRTTDIADVSILPVGSARGHHASTLSPGALRRLINEAKQNFEVIMIDTGPILGSIEASLVCAAADGVVLAVARGQQRPMVEKALGHLAAIGARLAGVVFNRAQSSDFERSISGMSIRSISRHPNGNGNGNGHANGLAKPSEFGPVARAVAGDSKR